MNQLDIDFPMHHVTPETEKTSALFQPYPQHFVATSTWWEMFYCLVRELHCFCQRHVLQMSFEIFAVTLTESYVYNIGSHFKESGAKYSNPVIFGQWSHPKKLLNVQLVLFMFQNKLDILDHPRAFICLSSENGLNIKTKQNSKP